MKILWFPRLQFDIDKLHITTWREMCKELENRGVEVRLAVVGKDVNKVLGRDYIRIPVIKTRFLRIATFWIFGWLVFLKHYFSYEPDVIILDLFTFIFSFPLALFLNRKCIYIVDNRTPFYNVSAQKPSWLDRVMKLYTKCCFLYCKHVLDGMTVITKYYQKKTSLEHHFNIEKIGVWQSGVNPDSFSFDKFTDVEAPSIFKKKLILMQHGEISQNRGLFESVQAMNLLRDLDIALILAGDAIGKNKTKEKLEELIRNLELESLVHILPPVPYQQVPRLLSSCDCAVLAYPNIEYWNNNNPIKLLEYLAMGKVVICTDMWTFRDVLNDKRCAVYLKDNRPETIAAGVRYCYKNRESLREWGKDALDIVNTRFTWQHQAQNLLVFVEKIRLSRASGN